MSVADDPSRFAGLTPGQLEVLRLLAVGHTAKTIAAQLGCSETAINERLRDARRKTGVGSSRELARHLSARKIWDKNIELPLRRSTGDDQARPALPGSKSSKGIRIMLVATFAASVGLAMLAVPIQHQDAGTPAAANAASAPLALAGSWALDTARVPEGERPQRVTITFRFSPEQKWTTRVQVVLPDGSTRQAESTAAPDGVPVAIAGNMDNVDSAALRQPTPNTLVLTLGKNGAPVSTRVYTVAKDRKSMTETIIWAGTALPKLETTYFTRVD